ncbi:MAG: peptidase S8, partial [Chitinophagaceae bacterium]
MRRICLSLLFACTLPVSVYAQNDWYLKGPEKDEVYGIDLQGALDKLKGRQATPIVVAVLDIGTDINHQELKDIAWTNPKEIAGNGKDDDGNGYVDDIHGWNFLGGPTADIMYEST